jgi:RNA polymerase sigma factor (sigma-70 family)
MATVPRTPDAELLRRLRSRDRLAWEELYAEYQPRLRGFAYRLAGNVHDADDLVQETFVRAVPRLDQLDPETADVGAYLFTTLRNLFLKQVEREKRAQPVAEVPEPAVPAPIEDDPERSSLLVRQQDEVRRANARLQPRQRLVLALRELEDRSYAEIGELVGMKENAVAQLIFRARESLRTELRLLQVDPEQLPEECRRFLPLLAAHLDGQLKGARQEETLAHLDGCERCQAALADMREASRRYRTLLPLPMGEDEAKAAIDARLTSSGYWDGPRRLWLVGRAAKVGAVAATLVLLFGGGTAAGIVFSGADRLSVAPLPTTSSSEETTTSETAPPARTTSEPLPTTTSSQTTTTSETETTETTPPTTPVVTTESEPRPAVTEPEPPTTTTEKAPPEPPVDKTAPTVRITSAPGPASASAAATIAFSASEKGVVFACKLDAAAYGPCASPVQLANLAAGEHRFWVLATDEAGNAGEPATVVWTYTPPDTTGPTVTITSAPAASTTETTAGFAFTANEANVTFACSLDGAAFAACTSPVSYARLVRAPHGFAVRATDQAGNTGPETTHAWTIVAPPLPDLHVSAFSRFSITISNRGNAAAGQSTLTIALVGTFTVKPIPPGGSITLSWSTCRVGTYAAIVDRTQAVTESNESNNTATLQNTCGR